MNAANRIPAAIAAANAPLPAAPAPGRSGMEPEDPAGSLSPTG